MDVLVWIGAGVSVIGLGGILWCILTVTGAKRAGLDDAALRAKMKSVVTVNLVALLVSVLGLMIVVLGIVLG
ncbi:hypothetical protein BFP70_04870 [Thioclava sp. SK-1]|uniref:hypothetical protein n=1 Tax=Thioclava sp. SK-1 TaxID=1889770 RepID=UPI0008266A90|nr:hypothetical protein [Thioclava sp. SK-1]OCX66555.1 hypothetical protein BFP70_04870 [Thioclava sp. SK-1]